MTPSPEVFIVAAVRSAIGTHGGMLKDTPLAEPATLPVKTALARSGAPANAIGHLVMGTVIPTDPRDAYLSRVAAVNAGLPKETPAFNVNRLCGSGLKVHDLAVIESNEALAAQTRAVVRQLDLDSGKVDPNGSGISLGHPIGATGAIITTKALYELERIGGGQGIAAIFERV